MDRPTITRETTLFDACEIVAEHCPAEMEITIDLSEGSGSVSLYDCYGAPISYDSNFEDICDQLEDALSYAEAIHRGEINPADC